MAKPSNTIWWIAAVGGIVFLLGFNTFKDYFSSDPKKDFGVPCINPALPIPPQYHIHPKLKIIVNGGDIQLTANVGLKFLGCERALHTHDASGELHIEPNTYQEFTLAQFFGLWGKPFSREQILDRRADAEHEIVVTVNGAPSSDFENLILRDKQEIVIEYKEKVASH